MLISGQIYSGFIALWNAAEHYNPHKGTTFSTYAVAAIRNAMIACVTKKMKSLPETSLDALHSENMNCYLDGEQYLVDPLNILLQSHNDRESYEALYEIKSQQKGKKNKSAIQSLINEISGMSREDNAEFIGYSLGSLSSMISLGKKLTRETTWLKQLANRYQISSDEDIA